jgi:hypothetical protein
MEMRSNAPEAVRFTFWMNFCYNSRTNVTVLSDVGIDLDLGGGSRLDAYPLWLALVRTCQDLANCR